MGKEVKQIKAPVIKPEIEWPFRLFGSVFLLLIIITISCIILILRNNLIGKQIDETINAFYDWCGEKGIVLEDIIISGREKAAKDDILAKLNLNRGDNLLKINIREMKQKLEELPWVKEANIRKSFFPNTITINIVENEVRAIWQINEKFYPLDADGNVIEAKYEITKPILLIVGADAPKNFKHLIETLKNTNEEYVNRIKVANYISKRRWNVIFDDIHKGVTIKLPEENIEEAWKKLLKLDKSKGIFKRKLTIIDLRLPDKVVVKLRKESLDDISKFNKFKEQKL